MSDLKQTIYLRQSSGFGPWVECEKSHPDAVAFDRRTQPEATAPAQDLSAAILRLQKANVALKTQTKLPAMAEAIELQAASKALLAAALTSSANALSAGDRVDAVPSYAAQLSTGLNDPFSRQPQPVAEQHARIEKAEREAVIEFGEPLQKLGARLTELLDDDQWNEVEPLLLAIAASQHAAEPVAWVPVHPVNGPLWANTVENLESYRPANYPVRALFFKHPPFEVGAHLAIQQQDERAAFEAWAKYCGLRLDMATHQFAWEGWKARAFHAKKGGAANCQDNEGEKA